MICFNIVFIIFNVISLWIINNPHSMYVTLRRFLIDFMKNRRWKEKVCCYNLLALSRPLAAAAAAASIPSNQTMSVLAIVFLNT